MKDDVQSFSHNFDSSAKWDSAASIMDNMELDTDSLSKLSEVDAFAAYADDESGDALPFYEAEGQVLALWDQLNELKLEMALLEASMNPPPGERTSSRRHGLC